MSGGRIKSVGLGPSLACLFFGGVALALKGLWWPAVESAVCYELVWWSCGHFGIPVVGFLLVLIFHVGIAFWVNKYQIQKLLKQGWAFVDDEDKQSWKNYVSRHKHK